MDKSNYIFRAYDIRGIFNQELTAEMSTKIGMAYGTYLGGKGNIFIGRDGRTSSKIVENAFISGLASTGCNCISGGLIPIPVSNFHIWLGKYSGGAYITASHNPSEYNGMRFRHDDGTGFTKENEIIKDLFENNEFHLVPWNELGGISYLNSEECVDQYLDFILKKTYVERKLKVVLDLGNGVSALSAPKAFEISGAKVFTINDSIDGTFPGRPSEPNNKTLGSLKDTVIDKKADFGAGYDGDGDRVIFIDDEGRLVSSENIGILISRELLKKKGGTIVANIECSMIIDEEIQKLGGKVIRVRVGDVFISEAIKKHNALFALETSAHFFFPDFYPFDDPLITSMKLGQILSKSNQKFSDIVDEIPHYPKITKNFSCHDNIKFRVMERIITIWSKRGYKLDLTDGAKVSFEDGWALLRPSNTTPLIRASVEANSKNRVRELMRMVEKDFTGACE
tara:strand:+ start:2391 stop:3749 length:1359 start_codon:yes stop_codon:yes gene_type:complete